jgi:hypothetical protein
MKAQTNSHCDRMPPESWRVHGEDLGENATVLERTRPLVHEDTSDVAKAMRFDLVDGRQTSPRYVVPPFC